MNTQMWVHPITDLHIKQVQSLGFVVIPPIAKVNLNATCFFFVLLIKLFARGLNLWVRVQLAVCFM